MRKLAISAAISLVPSVGLAATATVPFNGIVTSTCVIAVSSAGALGANAAFTKLSSFTGQGMSGQASILTTGPGFSLSTDAPTAWGSAPPGGGDDVTFSTWYDASGATSASNVPGSVQTALGNGVTLVDVDLEAEKSIGTFPSGGYVADVTVICE